MANTLAGPHRDLHLTSVDGGNDMRKRRKVRKGTKSCWECKRRKIRCIFVGEKSVVCVGCERRGTNCVGQDSPEDLVPLHTNNDGHLKDRLARVEKALNEVLDSGKRGVSFTQEVSRIEASRNNRNNQERASSGCDSQTTNPSLNASFNPDHTSEQHVTAVRSNFSIPSHSTITAHLLSVFPANSDLRLLSEDSARTCLYTMLVYTQPHSKLKKEISPATCPPICLPGNDTHPVNVAISMLMFAISLQSPLGEGFSGLSMPKAVISHQLVATVSTWVTTREEMYGTLESLLCIMLEGIYKTNCGDLRQAWLVFRRAIAAAQVMGIHRVPLPVLNRLTPGLDVDPHFMWFRIVYMDRYLSLLLGLPQGTFDIAKGALQTLEDEPPLGKMERRLTIIAGRILERNEAKPLPPNIEMIRSIDSDLLQISQSMPSAFWRSISFRGLQVGSQQALLESQRLAAQVYYHGLLLQLHLPYTICHLGEIVDESYSQTTSINAGRAILTSFIAHRSFNPVSSCSKPVDFYAFLAAITLLLVHLDSHNRNSAVNAMAHQWSSDRALLEEALERMDLVSKLNSVGYTEKSAGLIRRLLDVEAEASRRAIHVTINIRPDDAPIAKHGTQLCFHIPYIGFVDIVSGTAPRGRSKSPTLPAATLISDANPIDQHLPYHDTQVDAAVNSSNPNELLCDDFDSSPYWSQSLSEITANIDDWVFQGVDTSYLVNLSLT